MCVRLVVVSTDFGPGRPPDLDPSAREVGWYPDPIHPGQQVYWTGERWTRGQVPQARRDAAPLGARFRYAALATRILLGIQVATSVVGAAAYLRIAAQLGAGATADETAQGVEAAGRLLTVTTIGELILLLVTAVLWCAWQVILARSDVIHVGDLRRSVGWHLASWVVPLVSLWFPLQNVADLDTAARAPRDARGHRLAGVGTGAHAVRPGPAPLLWAWWVTFLLSTVLDRLAGAGLDTFAGSAQLRGALTLQAYAAFAEFVSAVLAILVVGRITTAALRATHPARSSRTQSGRRSGRTGGEPRRTAGPTSRVTSPEPAEASTPEPAVAHTPEPRAAAAEDPPLTRAEIRRRREGR